MDINYSMQVDFTQRSFSISGDKDFVEKYYELLHSTFCGNKTDIDEFIEKQSDKDPSMQQKFSDVVRKSEEYGIFYIDDNGQLVISTPVPGKNAREKMRNVARILLIANGNGPMSNDAIREQCIKQACFDSPNFAKAFKEAPDFIVKHTSKQKWTVELTVPGKKIAYELLEEMCSSLD